MQRMLAVMVVVGLAAACSGDDDSAETATTPEPTAATTTESPATTATATTMPSTTTPPPTTTTEPPATTTDPPLTTIDPPLTTIDPLENLTESVARDAQAGDDVLFEVLADPSAEDGEERLREYFAGDALGLALDLLEQFRRDDLTVVAHPSIERTFGPSGEPRLIQGLPSAIVEVETCRLDSDIVLAPVNDSDTRVPINGTISRTEALSVFVLTDGILQLESWIASSESVGEEPCE